EKPGMLEARGAQQLDREKLHFSALDMFGDFFEQTSGEALDEEQKEVMRRLIDELAKEGTP
ncbi:exonuclease sbcCD subunit D, partial [Halomonas sp. 707D4]|nr:exonuclease sbcCD subunit D [Halomonas sp. 707D4]